MPSLSQITICKNLSPLSHVTQTLQIQLKIWFHLIMDQLFSQELHTKIICAFTRQETTELTSQEECALELKSSWPLTSSMVNLRLMESLVLPQITMKEAILDHCTTRVK